MKPKERTQQRLHIQLNKSSAWYAQSANVQPMFTNNETHNEKCVVYDYDTCVQHTLRIDT